MSNSNSIHKPPAMPVRIEKVLPIPREHGFMGVNLIDAGGL